MGESLTIKDNQELAQDASTNDLITDKRYISPISKIKGQVNFDESQIDEQTSPLSPFKEGHLG
jgi:hypothetical protein